MMRYNEVLSGYTADRARMWARKLGELLLLAPDDATEGHRGLAGMSGRVLALRALAQATGDSRYRERAREELRNVILHDDRPTIGLFTGISGLRAVCAIMAGDEPDCLGLMAQCDDYVEAALPDPKTAIVTDAGDYDIIGGWSGAQLARHVNHPPQSKRLIELLTCMLFDSQRWQCVHPLRPREPAENDLGMAHGIAGVLTAVVLSIPEGDAKLNALLSHQARDLIRYATKTGLVTAWPAAAQRPNTLSRPAWCYGSVGIGSALYWTGRFLSEEAVVAFACAALESVARQPCEDWNLHDLGLCHGVFGNAVAFASVGFAARSATMLDASRRAVLYGLQVLESQQGQCWVNNAQSERYNAFGELDGSAGIIAALLSLVGDSDPAWMLCHGLRPLETPL